MLEIYDFEITKTFQLSVTLIFAVQNTVVVIFICRFGMLLFLDHLYSDIPNYGFKQRQGTYRFLGKSF